MPGDGTCAVGDWRFTPTPVGNAKWTGTASHPASVHPHACGECRHRKYFPKQFDGSPPRLWGMLSDCSALPAASRFTPTPVGNARRRDETCTQAAVHPHACGECVFDRFERVCVSGSPPRLWGMPLPHPSDRAVPRFTPTPVGNALIVGNLPRRLTVHPHACGECLQQHIKRRQLCGSPPRLWGMPQGQRSSPHPVTVHPHACGECMHCRLQFA